MQKGDWVRIGSDDTLIFGEIVEFDHNWVIVYIPENGNMTFNMNKCTPVSKDFVDQVIRPCKENIQVDDGALEGRILIYEDEHIFTTVSSIKYPTTREWSKMENTYTIKKKTVFDIIDELKNKYRNLLNGSVSKDLCGIYSNYIETLNEVESKLQEIE